MTSAGRDLTTWSGFLPRELKDRLAFYYLVCFIAISFLFEYLYMFPKFYDYFTTEFYVHTAFTLFLVHNLYGNLYKIMAIDASGRSSDLPSVLQPQWKYCYVCRLNSPPRAYHCTQCNECILKRDHHFAFGGCCVGYHNHRFYIFCLVYIFVLSQYMFWWHWNYIWETFGGFSLATVWYIFFPQFALIFQQIGFVQFLLCGIMMTSIVGFCGSLYLLGTQIILICRGQTQHEYAQNIRIYDLGWALNFKDVIGARWMFAWISPFISSPLLGDGLRFPDRKEFEQVRDM